MLRTRLATAIVGASLLVATAGCSGSDASPGGPQAPTDGSYVYLASSEGSTQSTALAIAGEQVALTQGSGTTTASMGDPAPPAVLCPPSGEGRALTLDAPLTIGAVALASPALFGDCGQTTPKRVTVIDLDSYEEAGGPFGYTRWVEFCETSDPDCPASTD